MSFLLTSCSVRLHESGFWHTSLGISVAGTILKEAIDDLEWPGGSVQITMQRDPAKLTLKSTGNGSLEVHCQHGMCVNYNACYLQRCSIP